MYLTAQVKPEDGDVTPQRAAETKQMPSRSLSVFVLCRFKLSEVSRCSPTPSESLNVLHTIPLKGGSPFAIGLRESTRAETGLVFGFFSSHFIS
jgi:hypothetical protein